MRGQAPGNDGEECNPSLRSKPRWIFSPFTLLLPLALLVMLESLLATISTSLAMITMQVELSSPERQLKKEGKGEKRNVQAKDTRMNTQRHGWTATALTNVSKKTCKGWFSGATLSKKPARSSQRVTPSTTELLVLSGLWSKWHWRSENLCVIHRPPSAGQLQPVPRACQLDWLFNSECSILRILSGRTRQLGQEI